MEKSKALYGVGCLDDPQDIEGLFFVTFNTTDEKEAINLAKCIVGKFAEKALVVINEKGELFPF